MKKIEPLKNVIRVRIQEELRNKTVVEKEQVQGQKSRQVNIQTDNEGNVRSFKLHRRIKNQ